MRFNIKYTKLGNFFFFVSNLSEWHFSCRKQYNLKWLEDRPLSAIEKEKLDIFMKIMKRYNFSQYLGFYFFTENKEKNVWDKLKKIISTQEYAKLKTIFEVFKPRFEEIWNKNNEVLSNNVKIFKKENNRPCYQKINKHLQDFFGQKIQAKFKKVNVYLIKHSLENWRIAGGANLQKKGITLECNMLIAKDASSELALAVTYHEFIHLVFQNKFNKIIKKVVAKTGKKNILFFSGRSVEELITEIIINSFFPRGYLADKYLHYKPFKRNLKANFEKYKIAHDLFTQGESANFLDVVYFVVYHLYPLTRQYIAKKKKIDTDYVEKIIAFLKKEKAG